MRKIARALQLDSAGGNRSAQAFGVVAKGRGGIPFAMVPGMNSRVGIRSIDADAGSSG